MIRIKKCPKCGVFFDCYCNSNVKTCWCADVKLKPETLKKLRMYFNNCLCPKCLSAIEKEFEAVKLPQNP